MYVVAAPPPSCKDSCVCRFQRRVARCVCDPFDSGSSRREIPTSVRSSRGAPPPSRTHSPPMRGQIPPTHLIRILYKVIFSCSFTPRPLMIVHTFLYLCLCSVPRRGGPVLSAAPPLAAQNRRPIARVRRCWCPSSYPVYDHHRPLRAAVSAPSSSFDIISFVE